MQSLLRLIDPRRRSGGTVATQNSVHNTSGDPPSTNGSVPPSHSNGTSSKDAPSSSSSPQPPAPLSVTVPTSAPPSQPSTPSSSLSSSSPAPAISAAPPASVPASTSFPVGEKFYGLENSANICYVNSVLQALYACRPFRQHVLVYHEEQQRRVRREAGESLLTALAQLFYRIQTSKKSRGVVSPSAFVKKLKKANEQFDSTSHQDAQEFLIFLLNDISDAIKADKRDRRAEVVALAAREAAAGHGAVAVPRKSAFSALFSSSHPATPSHAAAAAASGGVGEANGDVTTSSAAPTVLPNLSSLSAATALGVATPSTTDIASVTKDAGVEASTSAHASSSSSSSSPSTPTSSTASSSSAFSSSSAPLPPPSATPPSSADLPDPSWVQSLFEGTLTNVTECIRCGSITHRDESFLDLSVDLVDHHSITSCLRSFSQSETLDGADKFLCDHCGCRQEAVKSLQIKATPPILILHMKRFKYSEAIRAYAKLCYRITFPLTLRLDHVTDCPSALYSLTAVVVHIGNGARSGHYVCMCRGSNGQFYLYDDATVTAITERDVQATFGSEMGGSHQDGYLLFWSREDEGQGQGKFIDHPRAALNREEQQAAAAANGVDASHATDGQSSAPLEPAPAIAVSG